MSRLGTVLPLFASASRLFDLPPERFALKLLSKGKVLHADTEAATLAPSHAAAPKLMVMASAREAVADVQGAASDPTVASFAAEHGSRKARLPSSKGVRQGTLVNIPAKRR